MAREVISKSPIVKRLRTIPLRKGVDLVSQLLGVLYIQYTLTLRGRSIAVDELFQLQKIRRAESRNRVPSFDSGKTLRPTAGI